MSFPMPDKDPDEVLDYALDWTDRLAGDTIASSTAVLDSGDVTIDSQGYSSAVHTVWLSGGTAGTVAHITMRIVTAAGRTYDESLKIKVKER